MGRRCCGLAAAAVISAPERGWPEKLWDVAGGPGFEPRLPGSEPGVLPLNYPPSSAGGPDSTRPGRGQLGYAAEFHALACRSVMDVPYRPHGKSNLPDRQPTGEPKLRRRDRRAGRQGAHRPRFRQRARGKCLDYSGPAPGSRRKPLGTGPVPQIGHPLRGWALILLHRPSDAGFLRSGAHGPDGRSAPVLENPRRPAPSGASGSVQRIPAHPSGASRP